MDTTLDHRGALEETTAGANGIADQWLDTTWFSPGTNRRTWTPATDGVGVAQNSIMGYINRDVTKPVLTCLGCHTPHGAASSLNNGMGPVDNTTEANDWDGELLLAKNYGSYICYTCHLPAGTHPVDMPTNGNNDSSDYNWVTRTRAVANIYDSLPPNDVVRHTTDVVGDPNNTVTVFRPANYPYAQIFCESCHSVHSANSRWGDMILEDRKSVV